MSWSFRFVTKREGRRLRFGCNGTRTGRKSGDASDWELAGDTTRVEFVRFRNGGDRRNGYFLRANGELAEVELSRV